MAQIPGQLPLPGMGAPRAKGAFWSLLKNKVLGQIIGFGGGIAAAQAFEPALRPLGYEIEQLLTNRVLSPAELAELVIRGERTIGDAAGEASNSGINDERFAALVALAGNPPGPMDLLEMWRRGIIDEGRVERGIRQGRTRSEYIDAIKQLAQARLTPSEAAALVAQGTMTFEQGFEQAKAAGLSESLFQGLVAVATNPPAPGQTLDLLNRGELSEDQAKLALRRAGIRQEYVNAVMALRFAIPSAPDVVRFALREVYNPELAERYGIFEDFPPAAMSDALRAGISQETMLKYWGAHWDLPSRTQGYEMFHRRIITEQELEDLLRAADVMPGWRESLIELAFNPLTRVDVRRMYRDKVLTKAEVIDAYLDLGYSPENAKRLGEWVAKMRMQPEGEFTKSEVVALYQSRTMDRITAERNIATLGYGPDEVRLLLALADYRRDKSFRDGAIRVIRGRYMAREITRSETEEKLAGMGVPPDEVSDQVDLWTFELEEKPKRLSEPVARRAWTRGNITEEDYLARLIQMGMPESEARIQIEAFRPV